ncbi:MAG: dolichyl-phosphate beta-glucosyltransferase [Candidatus Woesearchaeota archaeon]
MIQISIVIPAFNEEKRIGPTLKKIVTYMNSKKYKYEIILVDDGSKDKTIEVAKKSFRNIKILRNKNNSGKGASVTKGILASKYPLVLFSDSDLATPIEEIEKLINEINKGNDIAIASRNMKGSNRKVNQSIMRQMLGKLFPLIVNMFVIRGIKDTQCGFKLFKSKEAKKIARNNRIKRFAFDVEYLFLANKYNYKISEVPVTWIDKEGTKVDPIKDSIRMLNELVKIHYYNITQKYNK